MQPASVVFETRLLTSNSNHMLREIPRMCNIAFRDPEMPSFSGAETQLRPTADYYYY